MNPKQWFCKHIFKEKNAVRLFERREAYWNGQTTILGVVKHRASYRECVKCFKKTIVEVLVLPED